DVGARTVCKMRIEHFCGRPPHGRRAARRIFERHLEAIFAELASSDRVDATRQKERLRIPGTERLQHFVASEKFAVDLCDSERAVDPSFPSKQAGIEPIESFTESCAQLGN